MLIPEITQSTRKTFLTPTEKTAFFYHLLAELSIAVFWGVNTLLGELAKKTLGASDFQAMALLQAIAPAMLLSVLWAVAMQGKKRVRRYLLLAGFLGRLPYALIFWADTPAQLLVIVYFCSLFHGIITPAMNGIFQANYRPEKRGLLVGLAFSSGTIVMMLSCRLAGHFLDQNDASYGLIFVVAAVFATLSCVFLARIPEHGLKPPKETLVGKTKVTNPVATIGAIAKLTAKILRDDPKFAAFERNFFIYGSGLWIMFTMHPIYLVENLNLSYSSISTAKALVGFAPAIILPPLYGLLLDRVKPFRFSTIVMSPVALFPLLLLAAAGQPPTLMLALVYAAFLAHGIGQTGVNLMWQLGSLHFAKTGNAYIYQGIHVSITGIRGILVPPLGYAIKILFGIQALFCFCSALIILAVVLMYKEARAGGS